MNSARGAVDKLVRARLLRAVAWSQSSGKLLSHEEQLVPYRGLYNDQGEAWTSFPFVYSDFCVGIVGFSTESLLCAFQ